MVTPIASLRALFQRNSTLDSLPEIYPASKRQTILLAGLAVLYLILQLRQHLVIQNATWVADSVDYIFPPEEINLANLFSWPHAKPWGAAVLYRFTGSSPLNIDLFQTLLSVFAWLSLAWIFSRSIRVPALKLLSFAIMLGFSLTDQVQMWNHVILSESLSISLMVFVIALWLSLIQRWNWAVLVALTFVLMYWINTREVNVYLALLMAVGIFLFGLIKRGRRFYWLVSCLLIVTSLITLRNSEQLTPPRWAFSLTNVILQRILPQPAYTDFFTSHGMPLNQELKELSGQWANSNDFAVFNDSDLNRFERWLYADGKQTYVSFLLKHPGYTLLTPLSNLKVMMAEPDLTGIYELKNYRSLYPSLIDNLLFPIRWFEVYTWLCLILIAGAILIKPWKFTRAFWLVAALLLLFVPHMYLVWHGDAMEIERHATQANIQFRLAIWMLTFILADALMLHLVERRESD